MIAALLEAAPAHRSRVRVRPGDDAAVLADGTALTVDALVEGVHFDGRLSPYDVGWKTIAASVSDLAAMGARPTWCLLALSLPDDDPAWVAGFAAGVGAACRAWDVDLVGGDTTGSPGPRVISATLGGPCVAEPLLRSGARPGDLLWVAGIVGRAGAGWMLPDPPDAALRALRHPEPPVALALDLARAGLVTAAMDLSDGLASDLPRLCAASGCGARVDPTALPADPVLDALDPEAARTCRLAAGDDYALLFASRPSVADEIARLARDHQVPCTRIGAFDASGVALPTDGPWPAVPFTHFGAAP